MTGGNNDHGDDGLQSEEVDTSTDASAAPEPSDAEPEPPRHDEPEPATPTDEAAEAAVDAEPDQPQPPASDESDQPDAGALPDEAATRAVTPVDADPDDTDDHDAKAHLNFRTTEARNRSVYRLANPWYRQLARFTVATFIFAALGIGAFLIARVIQDYVERDRLPSPGLVTPDIRESSFLVEASTGSIELDGTLTFDVSSDAFEFIGRADGPNADDWLTSPDGGAVYARADGATWRRLAADDPVVTNVRLTIEVLSRNDDADAILTNRIRRGFAELRELTEEGEGDIARTRYDVALELDRFSDRFPLQWNDFRADAIPAVDADQRHLLSFWLDAENVLVRVEDESAGWVWERLTYSDRRFEPPRPSPGQIVEAEVEFTGLTECASEPTGLEFATSLDSCEQAQLIGRQLAVSVDLATDDATAEAIFVEVCTVIQDSATDTALAGETVTMLAELLNDSGVCPGAPGLVPAGS